MPSYLGGVDAKQWLPVIGRGTLFYEEVTDFRKLWARHAYRANQILRRVYYLLSQHNLAQSDEQTTDPVENRD